MVTMWKNNVNLWIYYGYHRSFMPFSYFKMDITNGHTENVI